MSLFAGFLLAFELSFIINTQLNDLRKKYMFELRKSEVSVERISVCYVTENSAEHVIHCLPYSYTNDVINICYCNNMDAILMSE